MKTNHADAQYAERNKLDLAVPRRLFPSIVYGLHDVGWTNTVSSICYFSKQNIRYSYEGEEQKKYKRCTKEIKVKENCILTNDCEDKKEMKAEDFIWV